MRKAGSSITQFENTVHGFNAAYTIRATGLNKNTVYDKYREFENEIRETQIEDLAKRSEARQLQHSLVTDDLMSRVYNMFHGLELCIQEKLSKNEDVPIVLFNKYTELLGKIQGMQNSKYIHIPEKFEFCGQTYER